MSCIQATTTCKPSLGPVVRTHQKSPDKVYCASLSSTFHQKSRNLRSAKLTYSPLSNKRLTSICGISGAGSAGGASSSDDPLMESLKKAMEEVNKEKPLQDILKEKIPILDFGGDGGAGKKPRGGGGSGGAGEGSDFNFKEWLDEALQVFLATLGLISVYVYIVRGEELVLLARDYIKFWIWGKKSGRLVRRNERLE